MSNHIAQTISIMLSTTLFYQSVDRIPDNRWKKKEPKKTQKN